MLVVNAASTAGEFYQTEISGLCPNTTYEFSAWLINLGLTNTFCGAGIIPINVRFEIRNSTDTATLASGNTGSIGATSAGNPSWNEYGLVFTTGTETSVVLKMLNNGAGGCGNDLAIDDIVFKSCGDFVTIPDTSNNDSVTLCSSQAPYSTTLTANPDFSVYSTHFYQWQESTDGITWNDIVGETSSSISISTMITRYYRTKIAEAAFNLSNPLCVSFSNEYQVTINQLPSIPIINCWETATVNNATCSWDISGVQPTQPAMVNCWDNYVFNTTTCAWENTGSQDPQPPTVNCWDNFVFNTTSCTWENTGSQDTQPSQVNCWDNFVFNTTSCTWENTGSQDVQPPIVNCWDNFVFNTTICIWENAGSQDAEPTAVNCWDNFVFSTASCTWENTGSQDVEPMAVNCWDNFVFNTTICMWENTGSQDVEPPIVNCWDNFVFSTSSCTWENTNSQEAQPPQVNCWDNFVFNTTTCMWDNTGSQDAEPPIVNCWDSFAFDTTSCIWENIGIQPGDIIEESFELCENDSLLLQSNTEILNPLYIWNNGEITENITIDTPGVYSVEISGGVCSFETRVFTVTGVETPIIESVVSDGSNIIVLTSNTGDFLYSLDGIIFQPGNIFYNVEGDLYTVFVRENNCTDTVSTQHLHFYIPKFFTPNNDGIHDTFDLAGIEFYSSSEVSIFDRYGKLLKYSRNVPFSWNGTFANQDLPTNDYWYVIIIDGQKFTGHVTLKR